MRKMKPEDVREDFDKALDDVIAFYKTVKAALTKDSDETLLVQNTILTSATLWESFINDMFIAYINRDSNRFQDHLQDAFKASRTPKQDVIAENFVTVTFPKHLTVELITDLIDQRGENITFFDYSALKKGAAKYLIAGHRTGIDGLTNAQKATLSLWIALRNEIAHNSERSFHAMNDAMNAGGLHNTGLQRGVNNVKHVGAYLKSKPTPNSKPRIELILDEMKAIAALI